MDLDSRTLLLPCPHPSPPSGDRVGVLLPNGPEAAVCLLACVTYVTCAPLNVQLSPEELRSELASLKCRAIITPAASTSPSAPTPLPPATAALVDSLAESGSLVVLRLHPDRVHSGLFDLTGSSEPAAAAAGPAAAARRPLVAFIPNPNPPLNGPADLALVLHTAGTSGAKKRVPYDLRNLVTGAACILSSWRLRPSDVNLNMMPLFHIGGIARNLFAPLLAGKCWGEDSWPGPSRRT